MIEHEPLHLAVVLPSPVRAGQKRPADLDLGALLAVGVKARRTDDSPVEEIQRDESTAGLQRCREEPTKDLLPVTIGFRVLLPEERIGRNGEEVSPVLGAKRAKLEKATPERGLKREAHVLIVPGGPSRA